MVVAIVTAALALTPRYFAVLAGAFMLLLGYEWIRLCKASRVAKRVFALVLPVGIGICLLQPKIAIALYHPVVIGNSLIWLAIVLLLLTRPMAIGRSLWGRYGPEIGTLVLFSFWLTLVHLHHTHFWLLVATITCVAMFDTFSLVWGMQFGRRKLAPRLSPNKSWEGVAGGALAALTPIALLALADARAWIDSYTWYIPALAMSVVIAPFGDLFESLLKRLQGVKDSGQLLPGHGGLLDRVDSHLAVIPFCAFFALILA